MNPQNQQSNNYVLAPQNQPLGDKLIIPFSKCKNIIIEIFMIITSALVIVSVPPIAKIYTAAVFLLEQFFVLYFGNNKIELIKDEQNKILNVRLINFLFCARKKYEFDLPNTHFDVHLVDRKEGWQTPAYFRLLITNTYKDGIGIDLDSSNIKNKPAKLFQYFEHINIQKFINKEALKQTLNTFIGSSGNDESPVSFDINKYMNKSPDIFANFNKFINGIRFSKYVKMNDHFFSYYSKEPLKNKLCQGCFSRLIYLFHFYLIPLTVILNINLNIGYNKKNSKNDFEAIFPIAFFGYIGATMILYFICIGIGACCDKSTQFLRLDIIYSKDFERLFIGVVNNKESAYLNTYLFNLNEIDKFIIQKNNINDQGFYLKAINKGNGLISEICYLNEVQGELEGLMYLLNEKIANNNNLQTNNNNIQQINTNIDQQIIINSDQQGTNECPPPTINDTPTNNNGS